MEQIITIQDIEAGIPEKLRLFFQITSPNLHMIAKPAIESLWYAISAFSKVSRMRKTCAIIIGTQPFSVPIGSGILSFNPFADTIHVAIENIIFLNIDKLLNFPKNIQIATIIEEFVHALMDVKDEDLTSHIVSHIYPQANLINGKYTHIVE